MEFNLGWLEVLIIDAAAIATILTYLVTRQNKLDDKFNRQDDKIAELSAACIRREELANIIEPINHQLTEIRHRIDDVVGR